MLNGRSNVYLINFYLKNPSEEEKKKYLKRDKQVPLKCQSVGDILKDASQVASLRLFNLLYCKYLIPPRCLLAISGRINRRGARQKGQNEYLRLSDMSPPAFSLHLDVAGLTRRATWNNIVTSTMFAGLGWELNY